MKKYTYYVFCKGTTRDVHPVYRGKRKITDREAVLFGSDNDYDAAIGPFKTYRGAIFMARYGTSNPHCSTVNDAERLAKAFFVERRNTIAGIAKEE